MGIAVKVDEDLPIEVAEAVRAHGYEAQTVVEQELTGSADDQLWRILQREKRCLFTADKGFADIRLRPPGSHAGVVLLRLPRETRTGYVRLVQFLLTKLDLETVSGAVVVVSPDMIRLHRT